MSSAAQQLLCKRISAGGRYFLDNLPILRQAFRRICNLPNLRQAFRRICNPSLKNVRPVKPGDLKSVVKKGSTYQTRGFVIP